MGHHFDTELARQIPQLDMTDVYVFPSDVAGKTAAILVCNPKSKAGAVDNFHNDALYKFHAGADRAMTSGVTFTFRFLGPEITVSIAGQPVVGLDEAGTVTGQATIGEVAILGNGMRIWAGAIKDMFFGNQLGLRAFKEAAAEGRFKPDVFNNAQNAFANLLASAIVLEIPNSMLSQTVYYYGTSARLDSDHWHQVNRIGFVLMPHLYLSGNDNNTAKNGQSITTDAERQVLAARTIEQYSRLAGVQADPQAYASRIAEMLLPDAVPYRVGSAAHYSVEKPNGRNPTDDAMDVALTWLCGTPISDCVEAEPHRSSDHFPFVVPA